MTDVRILRVTPSEAAILDRVAHDVFDAPIDPARLAVYLAQPGHLMNVAVADGVVVGQARAIIHLHPDEPSELYVDNLGVTPDLRRQGIARRLMEDLFAWGRELGCEESWLGTEPDNIEARALYASLGGDLENIVMYAYDL